MSHEENLRQMYPDRQDVSGFIIISILIIALDKKHFLSATLLSQESP